MSEKKTIQSVLAVWFHDLADWRRRCAEDRDSDRNLCAADWLDDLASFIAELPDENSGIKMLKSFGWPVDAFRHGSGHEGAFIARKTGFGMASL